MNKELLEKLIAANKDKPQFDGFYCVGYGINDDDGLVASINLDIQQLYMYDCISKMSRGYYGGLADQLYYVKADILTELFTLPELVKKIEQWATDRKIFSQGTMEGQFRKLVSEVGELADNLGNADKAIDDIGDCLVCLTNLAKMHSLTLEQCGNHAWNQIKDRKGEMRNGTFVKEENL
jgi:NTP pyrophosphatase (non-canonical NTP hydrolase)